MQAVISIWKRELINYWRDKARIFSTLFQPLLFLAVLGFGLRETLAGSEDFGVDFVLFVFPGTIAISVALVSLFASISTINDREFGFLKEVLVAPVSRVSIAVGKMLGAATTSSAQGLILLVLAPVLGISLSLPMIPFLILFMVLEAFTVAGIGLLIASVVKTTQAFSVIMPLLIFPMVFLSGSFFPLTKAPLWLSAASYINPLTYGVDGMRQLLLGLQTSEEVLNDLSVLSVSEDAVFLGIFAAVVVLLATVAFQRS